MQYHLRDLASVIRSKNAGPYELTLDVMLRDEESYRIVRDSGILNKKTIAQLYHTTEDQIISIVYFPNAFAVKATIVRPLPAGDLGERDVYGAQQHMPLADLSFSWNGQPGGGRITS